MTHEDEQHGSHHHLHLEDSDDEDDDLFDPFAALIVGGHVPGFGLGNSDGQVYGSRERKNRLPNKDRNFSWTAARFNRPYFSSLSVYSEADFESRFRMPRRVFQRVENALSGRDIFVQRQAAAGRSGIHPRTRIIAALRIIAYGMSYDQVDELCEMSTSSARATFISFVNDVVRCFGQEYLRSLNEDELKRILSINEARGFPRCLDSWDCQHWQWKNCPVAWAGQFKGKEKTPTVVLEAISDGELWIWGCNFGSPGSMNEINVLDISKLVEQVLDGRMLPGFRFKVNDRERNVCYYLVDGIYPKWAIFIGTISEPVTHKDKHFSYCQEAVRKDVERGFGVLVSCWHILKYPCLFWDRDIMKNVICTAIILHNMIVEVRRDGYESELFDGAERALQQGNFIDKDGVPRAFNWSSRSGGSDGPVTDMAWASMLDAREKVITDEVDHFSLKHDLVEHVWKSHGIE